METTREHATITPEPFELTPGQVAYLREAMADGAASAIERMMPLIDRHIAEAVARHFRAAADAAAEAARKAVQS